MDVLIEPKEYRYRKSDREVTKGVVKQGWDIPFSSFPDSALQKIRRGLSSEKS